jgi:hypothetical protein
VSRFLAVLLLSFSPSLALAEPPRPFDRDAAILLAGQQVPAEIESYYFFVLDTESSVDEDGLEMADVLRRAAEEHEYLGIVGPDPQRNRATLLRALEAARDGDLRGATVIYVGPSSQADEVVARIGAAGADVRYVVYPEDGLSI